jgi:hypothetical protein
MEFSSRLFKRVDVMDATMDDALSPIGLLSDLWTKLVRPIIESISLKVRFEHILYGTETPSQ